MDKKSTAKLVKTLPTYKSDVGLYKLSKGIKVGKQTYNHIIVSRGGGLSGRIRSTVWLSKEDGTIVSPKAYASYGDIDISEVFVKLGYKLS